MNKILTIALAVIGAAALFSCKEEAPEPEASEITVFLQALPDAMTFGYDDEDIQSITVIALNTGWRAEVESSAQEWLKIMVESNIVRVCVEENTVEEPRTGKITIIPDDKTLNPVEVNVTQSLSEAIRITATKGFAWFWGDRHNSGFGSYRLILGDGDAIVKYVNQGEVNDIEVKNGYRIELDLLAEDMVIPGDFRVVGLKPGIYDASLDLKNSRFEFEKWSWLRTKVIIEGYKTSIRPKYEMSLLTHYLEGKLIENIPLIEGWVVIEEEGDDYSVRAELVTETGQKIVIDYPGPFDGLANRGCSSTFTEDLDLSKLVQGILNCYRVEINDLGVCLHWLAYLSTIEKEPRYDLDIQFFSPATDLSVLDDGVYTISEYPFSEFTINKFLVNKIEGGYLTNWARLIEGTVTVKHNGEDNYSFTIDALMDNYYKLTGFFEGDCEMK